MHFMGPLNRDVLAEVKLYRSVASAKQGLEPLYACERLCTSAAPCLMHDHKCKTLGGVHLQDRHGKETAPGAFMWRLHNLYL